MRTVMSEKDQFHTNVSIDVALKYNDGKEVNGQDGDQVLYTLTDGRVMYVPPIVKKRELRRAESDGRNCSRSRASQSELNPDDVAAINLTYMHLALAKGVCAAAFAAE